MDPRLASRENGRRKAAVVTTVALVAGAVATVGVSVALASPGSTAPTAPTVNTNGQSQDQLQPPAQAPTTSNNRRRAHTRSGSS